MSLSALALLSRLAVAARIRASQLPTHGAFQLREDHESETDRDVDREHSELTATLSVIWADRLSGEERPGATIKDPRLTQRHAGEAPTIARGSSVTFAGPEPVTDPGETLDLPDAAKSRSDPADPLGAEDFRILSELGQGGMGIVYLARQTSLSREVAVKMSRGPSVAEHHLAREALVTGNLDHPNIVPVHDLRRDESGNLFIAMKLVRGVSWDRLLRAPAGAQTSPPLSLREHVEILRKAGDAIGFAHSRGVIHRDIKPENIMVGDFGEVLLMDWGVAVEVETELHTGPTGEPRSATRTSAGTPAYMPPELALAQSEKVGPATDIYLLGAALYETLTGTPPHRGSNVMEVIAAAARGDVEAPESRAPGRDIPRELGRIALKAMANEPAARYADVRSFQHALRDYLSHEESLRLADEAVRDLDRLETPGSVALSLRYSLYTELLSRLRQALHLWEDNETALVGAARAHEAYATEAMHRGDLGLAEAQATLLASSPRADRARAETLRNSVGRRAALRSRGRLALVAVVGVLLLGWQSLSRWREDSARGAREAQAEKRRNDAVRAAWQAVFDDDLPALRSARRDLEEARGRPDYESKTQWLDWAHDLLQWRMGRWEGRIGSSTTPGEPPLVTRSEARQPGKPSPCADLLREPVLAGTLAGRRLDAACRGDEPPANDVLWPLLLELASQGLAPNALELIDRRWRVWESARSERGALSGDFGEARLALLQSAVWSRARQNALELGDLGAARRAEAEIIPYRLSADLFDRPAEAPTPSRLQLVLQWDGSWIAYDQRSGDVRWRTLSLVSPISRASVVPVDDGSYVITVGKQILHLSGEDGTVLERHIMDASVALSWPEPTDPSELRILVWADESRGLLQPLTLSRDGLDGPLLRLGGASESLSLNVKASHIRQQLYEEAAAWLGLTNEHRYFDYWEDVDASVRTRAYRGFIDATSRDPSNPFLWAFAMEAATGSMSVAEAEALGERAISLLAGLSPRELVVLGIVFEKSGFGERARTLYRRAAASFQEDHRNADLNLDYVGPAWELRRFGGSLFKKGHLERALELVEVSRRFSSYVSGDWRFYHRYSRWLRNNGRPGEATVMEARAKEAGNAGFGSELAISSRMAVILDTLVYNIPLAPLVLALLFARTFLRSRETRHADLYSLGWQNAWQRFTAFFSHPIDRARVSFLGYATRTERLLIALVGSSLVLSLCLALGALNRIGHMKSGGNSVAFDGRVGREPMLNFLEETLESGRTGAGVLRLLAEARRARGESDEALLATRRVLSSSPDDPIALNNLGVLDEERGRRQEALASYERAAPHPAGSAARWNLARLAGGGDVATALDELAHRDRLRVEHFGVGRPLWALCPLGDLMEAAAGWESLLGETRDALLTMATGPMAVFRLSEVWSYLPGLSAQGAGRQPSLRAFLLSVFAATYLTSLFAILAALWLPLSVRPLMHSPREPEPRFQAFLDRSRTRLAGWAKRTDSAGRWYRAGPGRAVAVAIKVSGWVLGTLAVISRWTKTLIALVGLVLPGTWDLVYGRALLGVVVSYLFVFSHALQPAITTGGIFSGIETSLSMSYFSEITSSVAHPDLVWLASLSRFVFWTVFAANFAWVLFRARQAGAFRRGPALLNGRGGETVRA